MTSHAIGAICVTQAIALLATAFNWWRVWQCPCEPTLRDAAFWTALAVAQGVVVMGFSALRLK